MKSSLEKRLETYRDGRASARECRRLEKIVASDAEAAAHLRATEWLGRNVREAWSEGPPAPSPERILTAIRPALRQIDAERTMARAAPRGWSWRTLFGPVPVVAVGAVAAALALFLVPLEMEKPLGQFASLINPQLVVPAAMSESLESPTAIYDLAQGDTPVMVFEAEDGSTVIWLLEEDDGVSSAASNRGIV